jgi:hypothetical protein
MPGVPKGSATRKLAGPDFLFKLTFTRVRGINLTTKSCKMRHANTRKKIARWIKSSIAAQKKRREKQLKKDIAYHKMINAKPLIYW